MPLRSCEEKLTEWGVRIQDHKPQGLDCPNLSLSSPQHNYFNRKIVEMAMVSPSTREITLLEPCMDTQYHNTDSCILIYMEWTKKMSGEPPQYITRSKLRDPVIGGERSCVRNRMQCASPGISLQNKRVPTDSPF